MPASEKIALRRAVRSRFDPEWREKESRALCSHVLDWEIYRNAAVVGGYMPMQHEADIIPLLEDVLRRDRVLALPLCGKAPEMTFRRVRQLDELVHGSYGLLEPRADAPIIAPDEIDLLLTPLEALDRQGMRLGKGGGYYDHLLQAGGMVTLGVVLSWQWVDTVPADQWDRPMQYAADQHGIQRLPMDGTQRR